MNAFFLGQTRTAWKIDRKNEFVEKANFVGDVCEYVNIYENVIRSSESVTVQTYRREWSPDISIPPL